MSNEKPTLSRREREVMDVLYPPGEATVAEVMGAMGDLCRGPSDDVFAVKLKSWLNF